MRRAAVGLAAALLAVAPHAPPSPAAEPMLRVRGTLFVTADGRPFEWRGVTAFALLAQVAGGREQDAVAYLRWARQHGFTVVRVLGMAQHLFQLSPGSGVQALPRLLRLAADRGLVVELVVFADTGSLKLDLERHVDRVAAAMAGADNVVVELANENDHPTQDLRLTDPDRLKALRARLPAGIPVSLGSLHGADLRVGRYGGGEYVTVHANRAGTEWEHVARSAVLAGLAREAGKPVVSDEPIGAAERDVRGRRSADPAVFFGLGLLGRMGGVPTTFHCEDCLRARIPGPRQDACAAAFVEGARLLPEDRGFSLLPGGAGEVLAAPAVAGASSVHAASDEAREWVVLAALGARDNLALPWAPGWKGEALARRPGIAVFRVRHEAGW